MAFNAQLYQQARPDLVHNWHAAHQALQAGDTSDRNVQFITQFQTFEDYLANDFQNNPNAEQQQSQVPVNPATGPASASGVIQNSQRPPTVPAAPGGGGSAGPVTSTGFSDLVAGNAPRPTTVTPPALPPAAVTTTTIDENGNPVVSSTGGNYNQTQVGGQSGSFNTTGNTATNTGSATNTTQASVGTTNNQQIGKTSGTQSTAGTTSNIGATTNTGQSANTGAQVTKTRASDDLGFGALLQGQAGQVGASDTQRNAFLVDTMNTGGQQFNSQVDQAVRGALSGPGMTGTGESASARAAGYAGAEVGRQNLAARLNASQQLAGPTGLSSLSTAANPYIGSESGTISSNQGLNTNTGTSTNVGTNVGTTNTTGFSDLVNAGTTSNLTGGSQNTTGFQNTQESTAGNASAASSQNAAGQIPQAQQVQTSSGGGCILCTVGIHHGLWKQKRVLRRVVAYKLQVAPDRFLPAAYGYFHLLSPLARLGLRSRLVARLFQPYARSVVYEELRVSKRRLPFRVGPWLCHWIGHGVCVAASKVLPVPKTLACQELSTLAKKHGVYFNFNQS